MALAQWRNWRCYQNVVVKMEAMLLTVVGVGRSRKGGVKVRAWLGDMGTMASKFLSGHLGHLFIFVTR